MTEQKKTDKPKSSLARDLGFYWEISSQIVLGLFVLGLLGYLADQYFDSFYVFTITGFIAGLYTSYAGVKRTISQWFGKDR